MTTLMDGASWNLRHHGYHDGHEVLTHAYQGNPLMDAEVIQNKQPEKMLQCHFGDQLCLLQQ